MMRMRAPVLDLPRQVRRVVWPCRLLGGPDDDSRQIQYVGVLLQGLGDRQIPTGCGVLLAPGE